MTRRNSTSMLLLAAAASLVLACGGCKKAEESPPPVPPAKPANPVKPPVQAQASSAQSVTSVTPSLDFSGRKDPFKPFIQPKAEKPAAASGSIPAAGALPIQGYPVEQFKVSGIIAGFKENKALIVDPAGKGYVVKAGMKMGNNNGVIMRITPSYLEVAERIRNDVTGKISRRTVKLALPKKN
ncbi:pilus assembly protein PilP [Geobacter grbiciae]|uniref:pilus assembly protein PilP n=1 Tax=Geobacter grbiciae TaxID=155042 RepID=UPI001C0166F7|nr:pilus assembly protein PilP [Geobacter grbiciae]MBT1076591.1 pilus assembly protein PilP [Geobacter grbiciae]